VRSASLETKHHIEKGARQPNCEKSDVNRRGPKMMVKNSTPTETRKHKSQDNTIYVTQKRSRFGRVGFVGGLDASGKTNRGTSVKKVEQGGTFSEGRFRNRSDGFGTQGEQQTELVMPLLPPAKNSAPVPKRRTTQRFRTVMSPDSERDREHKGVRQYITEKKKLSGSH